MNKKIGPGDSAQTGRRKEVGEEFLLISSRSPKDLEFSSTFKIPPGQWAILYAYNLDPDEAWALEMYFPQHHCCKEPMGCAPFLIDCKCQPTIGAGGSNPLVIPVPGEFRLHRTSASKAKSTITYELVPANSVPHKLFSGCCSCDSGSNCGGCN